MMSYSEFFYRLIFEKILPVLGGVALYMVILAANLVLLLMIVRLYDYIKTKLFKQ